MELFLKVLDMSLTASAVILIVLVLRFFLRKAPKVYSYALWSVVLFRLLCPVSLESGVSIVPPEAGFRPYANTVEVLEAVRPGQELNAAYLAVGDALNGGLDTVPVYVKPEYADGLGTGGGYVELMHAEVWALVIGRLWPAGVALMAACSLWSLWCLRRRLRGAVHLRDNIWQAGGLGTAFVLGLFQPKIYLPAGLEEGEMSYIIRHEEHHIRRFDHIIKVLAFLALCVHWFNPLVWLAFVLAGKDMEMSCDEAVMHKTGDDIRADYAQSLLGLATGHRRFAATPLAFGEGDPKSRIKNVLNWKKPGVKVTVIAVVVCLIAGVLCVSDPAKPVDTKQVERVYSQVLSLPEGALTINEDDASVTETLVLGEGREKLLDLLNSYAATRRAALPDWKPRASYQENAARLEMAGGGYYELRSWYVNGFSFHPAHFGEDEYDTTLAKYDADGNLVACWTMEYEFDSFFRYWLIDRAREQEEPAPPSRESGPTPWEPELTQPVHLSAYEVLHEAILDHHRSSQSGQYFCCESHVILASEEGTRYHPVTGDELKTEHYFLWVLYQEYLFTEDGIVDEGGAHIPTVITLTENADGSWSVFNYWEPRDGSYYAEDIKAIFPEDRVNDALDSQKYIRAQKQDCYEQAVAYAKTDPDVKMDVDVVIEGLLDVICSSPMESSNPKDHVADHPIEYLELKYYGDYTREYCRRQLAGLEEHMSYPSNLDLKARIMEMLLGELNL